LLWFCAVAFVLRLVYILILVPLNEDFYWEYGEIVKNLHAGKGYSLFYIKDSKIEFKSREGASPAPSAFMPPGYTAFLFPFFYIDNILLRNLLILIAQAIMGSLVVLVAYVVTRKYFTPLSAIIASLIVSLLPEFLYAAGSYSPVVILHLMVLLVFINLDNSKTMNEVGSAVGMSVLFALLIYLRSELALFVFAVVVMLFFRKQYRSALLIAGVCWALLLPWQVRNAATFGTFVPFTTNGGLNLYRGKQSGWNRCLGRRCYYGATASPQQG